MMEQLVAPKSSLLRGGILNFLLQNLLQFTLKAHPRTVVLELEMVTPSPPTEWIVRFSSTWSPQIIICFEERTFDPYRRIVILM